MPMLSLPGKTPQGFAEDTSAAEEDGDLRNLMRCRAYLVETYSDKKGAAAMRGDLLREYVRELDAVAPRFAEAAGRHRLCFAWRDAGTIRRRTHTALPAERAAALFALATEQARVAAEEDRRGADGIRRACAALCDAAGLLRAASEGEGGGDHAAGCQLRHMSGACMAAFEALMLAQALECYFELAVAGGKPAALCAKVAQQVGQDYDLAHRSMAAPELHQLDKSWPATAQAKAAYFRAEACLRSARLLRDNGDGAGDGVGVAIARLRQGLAALEGAKGALGRVSAPVRDAVKRLRKEVEADLAAAEQDNCRIYYARVPTAAALAELPGLPQQLVRPTDVEKVLVRGAEGKAPAAEQKRASLD
ncbi:hypothetical protein ZWY2020_006509 [Hordeum vulgare]|nr:hypothetical protein ZWY2020_006509 [Hordeum vulgare]